MTFANAKQRFSSRVADYVRYRPRYPQALLEVLRVECGLKQESVIADVGSGTGFLSELFLKNGNRVFGVEPNQEMREAGQELLREHCNFTSVNGSAEATTLADASADFITAGQAFHWFDQQAARREFVRILKLEGWAVILWNDRRVSETPFGREYEDLLVRFGTDYERVKDAYPEIRDMRRFFANDAFLFRELPNEQSFDLQGLAGRLQSSSYAPVEGQRNFAPMMAELERIFSTYQVEGRVRMQYTTQIYCGRLHQSGSQA